MHMLIGLLGLVVSVSSHATTPMAEKILSCRISSVQGDPSRSLMAWRQRFSAPQPGSGVSYLIHPDGQTYSCSLRDGNAYLFPFPGDARTQICMRHNDPIPPAYFVDQDPACFEAARKLVDGKNGLCRSFYGPELEQAFVGEIQEGINATVEAYRTMHLNRGTAPGQTPLAASVAAEFATMALENATRLHGWCDVPGVDRQALAQVIRELRSLIAALERRSSSGSGGGRAQGE